MLGRLLSDANATLAAPWELLPALTGNATDWEAIGLAFEAAVVGSFHFLRLWATFLLLFAVPVVRGVVAVGEALLPHFISLLKVAADYASELDPAHQAALAASSLLVLVCWRKGYIKKARLRYVQFRRDVQVRYRAFVASLSAKGRVVAQLVPHVLFFTLAYGSLFWLPQVVADVWSNEALLGFLSVGYPLIHSIGVIRHRRLYRHRRRPSMAVAQGQAAASTSSSASSGSTTAALRQRYEPNLLENEWRPYEPSLKFWVLWSVARCFVGLFTLFLPAFVTDFVAVPIYLRTIFMLWIHSPFTRGDITVYTWVGPLISPYANRLQDTENTSREDRNDAANILMRTLVAIRVLPEKHVHIMSDMWSQGPALIGLMFLFTPGFVTSRGVSLMGFGFPAYLVIGTLGEKRTRRYEWWLTYFCVAVSTDYVLTAIGSEISWLPFFFHLKLLVMVWLQFPYFRGAEKIFDAVFKSVFVVPKDNVEPKDKEE